MSKISRINKKKKGLLKESNNIEIDNCDDIEFLDNYKQTLEKRMLELKELEKRISSKPIIKNIITMKELEKIMGIGFKYKNKLFNKEIQKSNWKYRY